MGDNRGLPGPVTWQTETVIVIACPGQGSQKHGFLAPWLELDGVAESLAASSEASGVDLIRHGTESDDETIKDTAIAQPLIVAAGLVALDALRAAAGDARPAGIAGHSVGEITAAVGAGVLDATAGMSLVAVRARAMAEAAAQTPTGMSAVVGGDEAELLATLAELGLEPANFNGGGQIVVAGELPALAALAERAPRGARVIPLAVAGAFHTRHMSSAQEPLRAARADIAGQAPQLTLWTNNDGTTVDDGNRFLDLLVTQVASPVRWDRCMSSFADAGITGLIELAPAGALTGLAKRGLRGVPAVAVRTPDDLAAAVDMLRTAS